MQQANCATVLLSGGIDSAAAAYYFLEREFMVDALFVDYGQKPATEEQKAANELSKFLEIDLKTISVGSSTSFDTGEIPGRNAFLITSAITFGPPHAGLIVIGAHAGTPYYDCSPPFFERMNALVCEITSGTSVLSIPFLEWNKGEVFDYFQQTNLPLELTYSCEHGGTPPCGKCLSCLDRARFQC